MANQKYYDYLGTFLRQYLKKSHLNGYCLGVSGGIDSAVVANLIKKENLNLLCLIMPIDNSDYNDAILVCKEANVNYKIIDLSPIYHQYIELFGDINNISSNANLKARLRMITLYYYAQNLNYLVCGTDNADEFYTGYFTKYGDGGYDINPLRYLRKEEVYELATLLNVNQKIISKAPTPELVNGVNDEMELKVTYKELDSFLRGEEINLSSKNRIEYLHKISAHKRKMPVFPKKP